MKTIPIGADAVTAMSNSRTTLAIFVLCAIAWVVLVGRAWLNVKGPEDFVVTVTQAEVQSFARQQLNAVQQRSFAGDVELCAIIFEDSNGELGTTPVREGSKASCNIAYFDEPGMAPIASFHTHGSHDRDYDSEVPSIIDITSDVESGTDGYVSTPGGRFWHIDSRNRRAVMVCGEGCLNQDPRYRPCPADALKSAYTLEELDRRARQPLQAC